MIARSSGTSLLRSAAQKRWCSRMRSRTTSSPGVMGGACTHRHSGNGVTSFTVRAAAKPVSASPPTATAEASGVSAELFSKGSAPCSYTIVASSVLGNSAP